MSLKVWISHSKMGPFGAWSKRSSFTGSDVVGGSEDDKRAKKGAENYCAAGGPNKTKPEHMEFPCIAFPRKKVGGRNRHDLSG